MPIYEYSCRKCGKTIEVIQKFSDKPLKKHEKCGGMLTKLISASAFHLKGTGWYKTDYAAKPSPSNSSEESAGKNGGSGESAGKAKSTDSSSASESKASAEKPSKTPKSGASKE